MFFWQVEICPGVLYIFFVENPQTVETKSKTGKSASPDRQKTPKSAAKSVLSRCSYTFSGWVRDYFFSFRYFLCGFQPLVRKFCIKWTAVQIAAGELSQSPSCKGSFPPRRSMRKVYATPSSSFDGAVMSASSRMSAVAFSIATPIPASLIIVPSFGLSPKAITFSIVKPFMWHSCQRAEALLVVSPPTSRL